ncbi:hypothetical protein BJY00DRAFT_324420 [Aspergillus carlsbadensis]|nr:hypothetical protein BJY00DRAFT_324420 [Aspergillus carlsbadensis]
MQSIILTPERQRRRPTVSCTLCRKRKIRCNRERPCDNCLRSRSGDCTYEPHKGSLSLQSAAGQISRPVAGPGTGRDSADTSSPSTSTVHDAGGAPSAGGRRPSVGIPTPSSEQFSQHTETARLELRIRQLESQLETANATATAAQARTPVSVESGAVSGVETTSTRLGGTFHLHYRQGASGNSEPIVQSVSVKARMFGQSHWSVGGVSLIREIFTILEPHLHCQPSKAWAGIERCKSLARHIKSRRIPMHPFATSKLPSRTVADTLVANYLRETESIYRILHIPTFTRKYEETWNSDTDTNTDTTIAPDPAFLVQLKLVLALGAVTYDDKFSLRTSAIDWIHEAQTWMCGPKYKARLNIQSIQMSLLLLLAQERVGVIGELPWVSAGALLRKAIYMGLHRDPAHTGPGTTFDVEMHRRLWNTILELNLQTSLTSGGAPFISLADFDTASPSNLDDDQLEVQEAVPKLDGEYTQVSIAIELRRTFAQRLAAVKFLNDLSSTGAYEEALQLDAELRGAYRVVNQNLRAYSRSNTCPSPSSFNYETKALDFLMNRYISALHVPYFGAALHGNGNGNGNGNGTSYAFSRKSVVDCALKVWRATTPPSTSPFTSFTPPNESTSLSRLTTCSAGFYPSVAIHAAFLIAIELRAQLEEDDSLVPTPLRPDLLCVLEEAKAWSLRVVGAGETNVKGCLLLGLLAAHVQGLSRGVGRGEMAGLLVRAVEGVGEVCVPILEEMVTAQDREVGAWTGTKTHTQTGSGKPEDVAGDWSFATPYSAFDFTADPMSWMFNDDFGSDMSIF